MRENLGFKRSMGVAEDGKKQSLSLLIKDQI